MAADDIESKLDQILTYIGQLSQRCDKLDGRLDAVKSDGGKTPSLTDGDEFPGDIATAKRLAADAAKYTKYGSTANPGFADSVSVDPIQAMTLEANELRAKLRKVETAQRNFVSNMRPLDASEESAIRDFQVRADDCYRAAGDDVKCPAALAYERPIGYVTRILSDLKRWSPTWSKGDIESLPPAALRIAGNDIMSEAKAAFTRGDHYPKNILVPHAHVNPDNGMRTTTFTGPTFIRQFKLPQRTMRIRDPKELHADRYR
jgi:hypothetical protein